MRARITRELDRAPRLPHRRRRGRLARRRAHRPLPARAQHARRTAAGRVRPLPDLDVAQPRGPRASSSGCAATTRDASPSDAGGLLRARPLQPLPLDPRRARLPRRGRPRRGAGRAPALRLPHAVGSATRRRYGRAALTGRYDSCEDEVVAMLRDLLEQAARPRRRGRRALLRRGAERARSSPTPSATTGSCTTAAASRGTCATSTCSTRCARCSPSAAPTRKAVVWAHNSHVGDAAATEMGSARRAQHRPALPRALRRAPPTRRLRHRPRHRGRRRRLGRPDG